MTLEEATPVIEVWPDNAATVDVFTAMLTQWRVGVNGATGLDYGVLPVVFRLVGVSEEDQSDVFNGVRIMEDTALEMKRKAAQK